MESVDLMRVSTSLWMDTVGKGATQVFVNVKKKRLT